MLPSSPRRSAPVLLFVAAFFLLLSSERLIARDEGFYLLASDLVFRGRVVYLDFFYPQMPLLPYFYGAWMKLWGDGWLAARLLSGLTCGIIAWLIFRISSLRDGWAAGALAAILFCSSDLVISYFPTVKTYGLSTLFLLVSYFLATEGEAGSRRAFACGLAAGASVGVRLTVAPAAALIGISVLARSKKDFGMFLAGAVVTSLPSIALLAADPTVFLFNNIDYHIDRSSMSAEEQAAKRSLVVSSVLGMGKRFDLYDFQMPILIAGMLVRLIAAFRLGFAREDLAIAIFAILFAVSTLPTPTYTQYFSAAVPFAILPAVRGFAPLLSSGSKKAALFVAAGLALYCASLHQSLSVSTDTGERLIGISRPENARTWSIEAVEEVRRILDSKAGRDAGTAVALWPGFFAGSSVEVLHGMENNFALTHTRKNRMAPASIDRLHLTTMGRVKKAIEQREVRFVIAQRKTSGRPDFLSRLATSSGYREIASVEDHVVYER